MAMEALGGRMAEPHAAKENPKLPQGGSRVSWAAMKFDKAPPYVVEVFEAALATTPGVKRLMFGYPAGLRDGNMFCGVFGKQILVRLDAADRQRLLAEEGAEVFSPMPGRPMREYVLVPPSMLEDDRLLQSWIATAYDHAGTLPPKSASKAAVKPKKAPPRKKS
jgi:TfoX/Sxy family transcriptional regulator of competence genes